MTASVHWRSSVVPLHVVLVILSLLHASESIKVAYVFTDEDTANPYDPNSPANTKDRLLSTWDSIVYTLYDQASESSINSIVVKMLEKASCPTATTSGAVGYLRQLPGYQPDFWTYRVSGRNPQNFSALYQAYTDMKTFNPDVLAGSKIWLTSWLAKDIPKTSSVAYVYSIPNSLLAKVLVGVIQYLLVSIPQKKIMLSNSTEFFSLLPKSSSLTSNSATSANYFYQENQAYVSAYQADFYNTHVGQPSTYYYNGYEYSTDYFYSQSYQLPPQAPNITGTAGTGSLFYLLNATVTVVYDDTVDLVLVANILQLLKHSKVPQLSQATMFHIPANFTTLANITSYVQILTSNAPLLYLCLVSEQNANTIANAVDQLSSFVPLRYDSLFEFANFSQSTWLFWNLSSSLATKLSVAPYLLHLELNSLLPEWQSLCPSLNSSTFQYGGTAAPAASQIFECTFTVWLAALTLWQQISSDCSGPPASNVSALASSSPFQVYQSSGSLSFLSLQQFQGFGKYTTPFGFVDNKNGMTLAANTTTTTVKTCKYLPVRKGTNAALQAIGKVLFPVQSSNCYDIVTINLPPYYFTSDLVPYGICLSLADALSSLLGFSYTMTSTDVLSMSSTTPNSIPYMMINEIVDFAIAPILVDTSQSQWKSFRFTVPFMQAHYSVLQANTSVDPALQITAYQIMFAAYFTFENSLWILIGCTAIAVFLMLVVQDSLLPNRISFSIRSWPRTLHYVVARLVLGVSGTNPDTFSSQILIIFWCLCSLVIIFSYLANYSAMIISSNVNTSLSAPQELLSSGQPYSTLNDSDTMLFFQHSTLPAYQMMYAIMRRNLETNLTSALQSVLAGDISLIFHEPTNVFLANMYCLVSMAPFADNDFVLTITRAQDLFDSVVNEVNLNAALLQLEVSGMLSTITSSYWLRNQFNGSSNIYHLQDTISPYACKGTTKELYQLSNGLLENYAPVQLADLLGPILILLGAMLFTLFLSTLTRVSRIVQYRHSTSIRRKREKMLARVRRDITRAVNVLLGHRAHDKRLHNPDFEAEEVAERAARRDLHSILKNRTDVVADDEDAENAGELPRNKSTSFQQHALQITYEPETPTEQPQAQTKAARAAANQANLVTADVEQAQRRERLNVMGMNERGDDRDPRN